MVALSKMNLMAIAQLQLHEGSETASSLQILGAMLSAETVSSPAQVGVRVSWQLDNYKRRWCLVATWRYLMC